MAPSAHFLAKVAFSYHRVEQRCGTSPSPASQAAGCHPNWCPNHDSIRSNSPYLVHLGMNPTQLGGPLLAWCVQNDPLLGEESTGG